ncbi:uncharacterized protein LOC129146156 isoform X2 [Talpa occidentalis]|uniref:uncharacterized protein LOC129146156 isoform X2 n=1 Tax=Talpa occidentalis TaxID=50954 RepID=UPI0023F656BC|nr:uncharacterized protein LOC129146156 isoform X2 [Talpa occidentalis]
MWIKVTPRNCLAGRMPQEPSLLHLAPPGFRLTALSQTEQSDSSECLPTVQELSQTSDSTETDIKCAEETGESAFLYDVPQGHVPPAGELGPSKAIQVAIGTPEYLKLTLPLKGQLDTDQGPEGGPQAAGLIAPLLGEAPQGMEDSGQPAGGELTPPLLGEADPDPPPTG